MTLLDRNTDHASSTRFDDVAADDGVSRPIGAFDEHVGLQSRNDLVRRVFVKDDSSIHDAKAGEELRAFSLSVHRSAGALVSTNRSVRIDSDDESIAFLARSGDIPDVAGVKQIEDAVGKHNLSTVPALRRNGFGRLSSVHDSTAPNMRDLLAPHFVS
jgi:hypothetical protein